MQRHRFVPPDNFSWFWSKPSLTYPGSRTCLMLTFLGVRALLDFAFFPLFLLTMDFRPFFSGVGERIVSDLPLAPRFLARSSGWILGRTPPLAIVTPFSNCKEKQHKAAHYKFSKSALQQVLLTSEHKHTKPTLPKAPYLFCLSEENPIRGKTWQVPARLVSSQRTLLLYRSDSFLSFSAGLSAHLGDSQAVSEGKRTQALAGYLKNK